MAEIESLVGRALLGFGNAEFLLDHLLYKIGLTQSKFEFMGNINTGVKMKEYRAKVAESGFDKTEELIELMDEVDCFRELRNSLAHSMILKSMSNEELYIKHRFKSSKTGVQRFTESFTRAELERQIQEFSETRRRLNGMLREYQV
ncbi:hypothetical protein J0A68_19150 [Algoriphagus sp. H41]|uniref:Uncharacterized protein n=1 Tax=Algoriphagus oliviformis TaxID=2811231 RepID=A0ABS3C7J3_9BACT|nr:hypothetical protein [Algoriphagus oliviformis]MBN7813080.1 hypothetical protein [Algoriphagus oliviformis]